MKQYWIHSSLMMGVIAGVWFFCGFLGSWKALMWLRPGWALPPLGVILLAKYSAIIGVITALMFAAGMWWQKRAARSN